MDNRPDNCKVAATMDTIVGKWKIAIMLNLMYKGTMRFNELRHILPGVTQKMLTSHLRDLEEEGVIRRTVYPQVPPKVEYCVTEYGKTLKPVLDLMHEWGMAHLDRKKRQLDNPDSFVENQV